ncbi:DUF420 domain-containing protein [Lignipirellula cremea]|uniref:DUF420 domain-containing protein n=1 Tax=Lignipirellula cremea TaxID=2528010 RepID=A0A518DXD5_9BACT|nr:DUF420 domain-containing protein [Lignipirellula cremea]QDU96492.1 hypothetical protein Pla8534_43130 [Lignipirellula cremea]
MTPIWGETNGLLPNRGTLMLDFVFLAMFAIVVLMGISLVLVKQRRYQLHKWLQIVMAVVLLGAVTAFEIDMRIGYGWKTYAADSPYFTPGWNPVWYSLIVHLCFAVPTPFVWAYVIFEAVRKFPNPPTPGAHSHRHKKLGWLATVGMTMTAVTGWVFYWLAFVA